MNTIEQSIAFLGMMSILGTIALPVSTRTPQVLIAQVSTEEFVNRGTEKSRRQDYQGAMTDFDEAIRMFDIILFPAKKL